MARNLAGTAQTSSGLDTMTLLRQIQDELASSDVCLTCGGRRPNRHAADGARQRPMHDGWTDRIMTTDYTARNKPHPDSAEVESLRELATEV